MKYVGWCRAMIAAALLTGCLLVTTAFADVSVELVSGSYKVKIFGTISRQDATTIAQRENDLELGSYNPTFYLNSQGGDVDAAMSIGRIVRRIDGFTRVEHDAECFSSCALIYIAGVNRIVDWDANASGQIGLHRPYLASSPQKRDTIERETPKLMQNLKQYVGEMGLPENFYGVMLSTEPSSMSLYGSK
jgi:hypothetical protein